MAQIPNFLGKSHVQFEAGRTRNYHVFRGRHESFGAVALKVSAPEGRPLHQVRLLFANALRAAKSTTHANLIRMYAVEEDAIHGPVLVMEDFHGGTLLDLTSRKPDPEVLLPLLIQALWGLEALHKGGWIHGDVKPGNFMVNTQGAVKLIDLEHARTLQDTRPLEREGSLPYSAPETLKTLRKDLATDVYSFAVSLVELLTGHLPFHAPTAETTARAIVKNEPTFPLDLPEGLRKVFQLALHKDPTRRQQDLGHLMSQVIAECPIPEDQRIAFLEMLEGTRKLVSPHPFPDDVLPPIPDSSGGGPRTTNPLPQSAISGIHEIALQSTPPKGAGPFPQSGPKGKAVELPLPRKDTQAPTAPTSGGKAWMWPAAGILLIAAGVGGYLVWKRPAPEGQPQAAVSMPVPAPSLLEVRSKPQGATVRINGEEKGLTPLRIEAPPAGSTPSLELELEGHQVWKGSLRSEEVAEPIHLEPLKAEPAASKTVTEVAPKTPPKPSTPASKNPFDQLRKREKL